MFLRNLIICRCIHGPFTKTLNPVGLRTFIFGPYKMAQRDLRLLNLTPISITWNGFPVLKSDVTRHATGSMDIFGPGSGGGYGCPAGVMDLGLWRRSDNMKLPDSTDSKLLANAEFSLSDGTAVTFRDNIEIFIRSSRPLLCEWWRSFWWFLARVRRTQTS